MAAKQKSLEATTSPKGGYYKEKGLKGFLLANKKQATKTFSLFPACVTAVLCNFAL